MDEEKIRHEMSIEGFTINKIMGFLDNCVKIIAEKNRETVFIKCFNLRQIFKSNIYKKWVNHEIKIGELLSTSNIQTGVVLSEKVYTDNYLLLVYEYCRHRTLE
jgi:serine/threonine protein kinase